MNFGSNFVYEYPESEEEYVSDEEFKDGMSRALSSSDDDEDNDVTPGRATAAPAAMAAAAAPAPTPLALPAPAPLPARRSRSSMASEERPPPPPPPRQEKAKSSSLFGRLFGSKGGGGSARATSSQSPASKPASKKKHHWQSSKSDNRSEELKRKWRRADTNVVSVKFDQLTAPSNMHTGDAVKCDGCQAVLSHISKVNMEADNTQVWKCEFCQQRNVVDLIEEEIPHIDDVTFMLQPAPSTTASGKSGTDESLVIFCVDTSGSMCVTTEVPGKINMRGDRTSQLQSLNTERQSQYLPRQKQNVTFVSRLQGVQAAVDHQLAEMAKDHPNRRVAVIPFSTEVTVLGDGSGQPVHLSGDKLYNHAELIKAGAELKQPQPIKDSRLTLGDKVFELEEGGQTALGPALLVAVSMACQAAGSKVIMCTDGMANVGLGQLDLPTQDPKYTEASQYYDEVSQMAVDKGVSISVISIKGTDCKMVELGKVADTTGGQVNIVDPLKLTEEFGSILADPIIATNVTATLQVHKRLYIRHEPDGASAAVRHVGNVTKNSEITFEYGKRRVPKKAKAPPKTDAKLLSGIFEASEPMYGNTLDAGYDKLNKEKPEAVYDNTKKESTETIYDNPKKESADAVYDNPKTDSVDVVYDNPKKDSVEAVYDNPRKDSAEAVDDNSKKDDAEPLYSKVQKDKTEPVPDSSKSDTAAAADPVYDKPKPGVHAIADGAVGGGEKAGEEEEEPMDTSENTTKTAADGPSSSAAGQAEDDNALAATRELPFQLQITYTDLDGAQAMRLITQCIPVTNDREVAEKAMNPVALTVHAAQQSARMAQEGHYTSSRLNAFMYQRLMVRNVKSEPSQRQEMEECYDMYLDNVGDFEHNIRGAQAREFSTRGRTYSDDEDSDEEQEYMSRVSVAKKKAKSKKSTSRSEVCEDTTARAIYSNAQLTAAKMRPPPIRTKAPTSKHSSVHRPKSSASTPKPFTSRPQPPPPPPPPRPEKKEDKDDEENTLL